MESNKTFIKDQSLLLRCELEGAGLIVFEVKEDEAGAVESFSS